MSRREQILGRDNVQLLEKFLLGERATIVKETLRHTNRHVLEVVIRDSNLPFELATSGIKRALGQRMVRQSLQLSQDKTAATCSVGRITTIIDRPQSRICIGCTIAFDGINQAVALAKGEVEPATHGWSAQHITEEIEVQVAGVVTTESLSSDDHMRLMGTLLAGDVRNFTCEVGQHNVPR